MLKESPSGKTIAANISIFAKYFLKKNLRRSLNLTFVCLSVLIPPSNPNTLITITIAIGTATNPPVSFASIESPIITAKNTVRNISGFSYHFAATMSANNDITSCNASLLMLPDIMINIG